MNTRKSSLIAFSVLFGLFLASTASSSPAEMLKNAKIFGDFKRCALRLSMQIDTSSGNKQRTIDVSFDESKGDSLLYAAIVDPAFLSNMKYLRTSRRGGPAQQWVKTSRGVMRVVGSGADEKVFGSDFTAEDFGGVSEADFDLSFLDGGAEKTAGIVRILARPRVKPSSYAYRIIGIDVDSGLIMTMDYCDAKDRITRSYRVDQIERQGGAAYPKSASMEDKASGGKTTLAILSLDLNPSLPARLFNPAGL